MAGFHHDGNDSDDMQAFDLEDEEEAGGDSNILMVIVISLLFMAAFGCVFWVAYNNGVAHGRSEAVAQAARLARQAPPDTGTSETVRLPIPSVAKTDETPSRAVKPQPRHSAPPPAVSKSQARAKPAATPGAEPKRVAKRAEPARRAAPAGTAAATAKAGGATAKAGGKVYRLQIGAYKSNKEAETAWKIYRGKHRGVLSGTSPHVQRVDLGAKGIWYRLQVGAFSEKTAAQSLCAKLKADGGACFLAR